jgi:hypothetical protein
MSFEYIGDEDLYFITGGSAHFIKKGQTIRDVDEAYFTKRYPNKIREIPGTTSKKDREMDVPSIDLLGLRAVVEGQSKVIERQSDQIDKLIEVLTCNNQQVRIVEPRHVNTDEIVNIPGIEKPKLETVFIPNVVNTDGITSQGVAGDMKTEGEEIDDKISKLKRFKKNK